MKTEAQYWELNAELLAIEATHDGLYLADANVDAENADIPHSHPEFWNRCYNSACVAAGQRCESAGLDINVLIGRTIY